MDARDSEDEFTREIDRSMLPERRDPCVSVFRAVIMQAFADAGSRSKKPDAMRAKEDARQWFEEGGEEFDTVCEMAGYQPEFVRQRYRIAQARQFFWRQPPENAPRSFPLSQRVWWALGALPPEFRHLIMRLPASHFGAADTRREVR